MVSKFDEAFFGKFIPSESKILALVHTHFIFILWKILINIFFGFLLPAFLYAKSWLINWNLDIIYLQILIFISFFKTIYDILDWYNDVWIVTDSGVIDLQWSLFSTTNVSIKFENIEWVEVSQTRIIDTFLNTWNLVIHKIWSETFSLENAFRPYKWVDYIEEAQRWLPFWEEEEEFFWENDEDNYEQENSFESSNNNDKFENMMEVLSEIVEEHLEKKKDWFSKREIQEIEEKRENFREKKGTIDLTRED